MNNIEIKNHDYWLKRADGYSEVNQEELQGVQNEKWSTFLDHEIKKQIKNKNRENIQILDIGAGPGFISIILCKLGYKVTALDFAETMIKEAKNNARNLAEHIMFVQGNALELPFANNSFDVVISRNLTWNLAKPADAYAEWNRVLKPGGKLMNFDANWYSYLIDDTMKTAYENDRKNVAKLKIEDYNIGENFDEMEQIAIERPMTKVNRPAWDEKCLSQIGMTNINAIIDVGNILYSEKEKINYASTPLFMVSGLKNKNNC